MRMLWLALEERVCQIAGDVADRLGCEHLAFWAWGTAFGASMEHDYRRDGLWTPREGE